LFLENITYIFIGIDFNKLVPVQTGEKRKGRKVLPGSVSGTVPAWVLKRARERINGTIKTYR
jgi:hypothetical protein